MDPGQLPSSAEFADYADILMDLSDVDLEGFSLEDVLEALVELCNHPVRKFACRICDMVPPLIEGD